MTVPRCHSLSGCQACRLPLAVTGRVAAKLLRPGAFSAMRHWQWARPGSRHVQCHVLEHTGRLTVTPGVTPGPRASLQFQCGIRQVNPGRARARCGTTGGAPQPDWPGQWRPSGGCRGSRSSTYGGSAPRAALRAGGCSHGGRELSSNSLSWFWNAHRPAWQGPGRLTQPGRAACDTPRAVGGARAGWG